MDTLYAHADSRNSYCNVVITDFSKAFDLIDHNIVIGKLLKLGVRPSVMPWVCSFLHKRSQCVRYKNELSEFHVLQGGVPQGTKFGPLCFLAQINDALQEPQQGISILKYVDDVSIVENGFANKDGNMQSILDDFSDWSVCNNMKLNPDKCAVMNVCFMKNPIRLPPLEICSQQLQMVDRVKILGVQISHDLKWNNHVSELVHKAHGKQYMLKMLKEI